MCRYPLRMGAPYDPMGNNLKIVARAAWRGAGQQCLQIVEDMGLAPMNVPVSAAHGGTLRPDGQQPQDAQESLARSRMPAASAAVSSSTPRARLTTACSDSGLRAASTATRALKHRRSALTGRPSLMPIGTGWPRRMGRAPP